LDGRASASDPISGGAGNNHYQNGSDQEPPAHTAAQAMHGHRLRETGTACFLFIGALNDSRLLHRDIH
jgi:hypothetical protein